MKGNDAEFTCQVSLVDTIVPLNKIMKGQWSRKNLPVKIQWWTPLAGVIEHSVTQLIVWPQRRPNKQKLPFRLLMSHIRLHLMNRTPWKIGVHHGNTAPTKAKCFTWLVVRKVCLTHERLQRTKFHIACRCFLCCEKGETSSHIFLHCKFTSQLWSYGPWSQPNRDQMDYA